jgi:hypothetical protein
LYGTPATEFYIGRIQVWADIDRDPHFTREDYNSISPTQAYDTYVFDFSNYNIPGLTNSINPYSRSIDRWLNISDLDEYKQSIMIMENGFNTSVIHITDEIFSMDCFYNDLYNYDLYVTLRIYCEQNNIGNILLLPMNNEKQQCGNDSGPASYASVGTNLYDVTWKLRVNRETKYFLFYNKPTAEFYIGHIRVWIDAGLPSDEELL